MSDRWLLVLGANSDIAVATAAKFAKEGWNVHLASRDMNSLAREASNLRLRYGIEAREVLFDATDYRSHATFWDEMNPKPEGVIVAFGFLGDQIQAQKDFSVARKIIESNYLGAVSILEVIAQDFEVKGSGFIVGISSVAGDRGRASNYIYGSAKAGFSAYLAGLRHRLAKVGAHVMTVKPGFVATKMTAGLDLPKKLLATPQEVAGAIYQGVDAKSNTIYAKKIWRMIMLIIRHVPEVIFKKSNL
ncbi:SDR family oxidoreductase [Trichloromonas acetexigens]|uniref:SDR family oxidoreductase n=1 Tax=Trichloromonas acetexigens TaxID=38815 RepID=A0A550JHM8_9BACT|nr:SDR family oxidoreductase [Desulfuromonas acetexigens]TRO82711.1 SDR family oxidoreductase [Desulfuromonas acetexigens]